MNEAAEGEVVEEIESSKAFFEVYDGAVYMFQVSPGSGGWAGVGWGGVGWGEVGWVGCVSASPQAQPAQPPLNQGMI